MRDRAWVLPTWFDFVEQAFAAIEVEPEYVFAIGTSSDETAGIISDRAPNALLTCTTEAPIPESASRWTSDRFNDLVVARNALLLCVRALGPDLFLSLDSDILLNPATLVNLVESLKSHTDWAAVGGKTYMTPSGTHCPSYAFNKPAGGLAREDSEGVFQVEILMALKLMQMEAYYVDYAFSEKGEDVAWSIACRNSGLKLGWDGRTCSKHVMNKKLFYVVDPRCGF